MRLSPMPGSAPPMWTRSYWGISTPASRPRASPRRWCCRRTPICASSARRGSRPPAQRGRRRGGARAARRVPAGGVEQMTTTPPAEIGRNLLKASYVREEANIDGGFAGIFGKVAGLYFQKYGDQSDALARIAAKNHKNGV